MASSRLPPAPAPIRALFRRFPLRTLDAPALPGSTAARARSRLYMFARRDADDAPSFNPACLKWQLVLRVAGVQVDVVKSNNHASPSGALPFVLPAAHELSLPHPDAPVCADGIAAYAGLIVPTHEPRRVAYEALVDQAIRPAWLYALYLLPANEPLVSDLYLPKSPLIRLTMLHDLRAAARSTILTSVRRPLIDAAQLVADAALAFAALDALLAHNDFFFAEPQPSVFDALVFSYTHLILPNSSVDWIDNPLEDALANCHNLCRHRAALYSRYWPTTAADATAAASAT